MSGGWNTIESDAGVFTYLLTTLGVKDVQFEELISLDSQSLASLSPFGVIFLFKYPVGEKPLDTPKDGEFDYSAVSGDEGGVWFAAQTIQNACGTQALLSVLMNKKEEVELGPTLQEFREFTGFFDADLKGEALSNSNQIRDAHNSFARSSPFVSDETKQATEDDDLFHFIGYASINGKLYELDGLQPAPISHGACKPEEFSEKIIPVLQRRIERYPAHEIRFNLLAMCKDLRIKAREFGDQEMLYREEEKRRAWQWENALRRHNFVGFVGELTKGVVKNKVDKGEYEKWVEDAKARTQKRVEEQKKRGKSGDEMDIS
ncbi:ubiquitin carboxyl-terminal hydrolase-6 [Elsinoe australis]|uniref:Ubiquitin carboxyl-terminal hydrolase n=1 Tax=Elsinoe australis TaxID=40998 RepID=A0A4U7B1I0_9PEZI|nr:ubiquitin carboxyl-terminal hydrolase-6 [Elsinoe australis]